MARSRARPGLAARARCCAALLCLAAPAPALAGEGVVCKYRKVRGQGYHSPAVWKKVPSYEEAARMCDEDEECTGFHYHPIAKQHYLYKHGTELITDPYVDDFTAYKKRMLTCEKPKASEDDTEDELGGEDLDAESDL